MKIKANIVINLELDGEMPPDDEIENAVLFLIKTMALSEDFDKPDEWALLVKSVIVDTLICEDDDEN